MKRVDKQCATCRRWLDLSNFPRRSSTDDRLRSCCRRCRNEMTIASKARKREALGPTTEKPEDYKERKAVTDGRAMHSLFDSLTRSRRADGRREIGETIAGVQRVDRDDG